MTLTAEPETTTTHSCTARYCADDIADALRRPRPTPEQRAVIEAPLEPLLVVAGAGSGKTETMSARVVFLVANGLVRGEEVLGLTFTRKAAAELAQRVRERLRALRAAGLGPDGDEEEAVSVDVDRPRIATYNSFAGALARDHALRVGADPDARLVTEAGAWQLAHDLVQGWEGDLGSDRSAASLTGAVLGLSGALGENLLGADEARALLLDLASDLVDKAPGGRATAPKRDVATSAASLHERAELMDVVAAYAARKRERGVMDFGDQVALAARIADAVPDVGAQLREQYRVVLLDEFQDTSVAQLELLGNLFGHGHPVTAVGDPNQAIYGWRGASAGSLADFPGRFPRALQDGATVPARTLALSTSWRNDRTILEVANTVSAPLRAPGATLGASVPVPELRAREGAAAGEVLTVYATSQSEETGLVADFLARRWRPGAAATAAVLCRKRSQFAPVVRALTAKGLPVRVLGMGGLLATPEIVDLRSALVAAHDPGRGDALVRLLTNERLGMVDLHALQDWARQLARRATTALSEDADRRLDPREEASIVEAVAHPPAAGWTSPRGHTLSEAGAARARRVGAVLARLRAMAHLSLPEQVVAAEQLLELDIEVAARAGTVSAGAARAALDAFAEVAAGFTAGTERPSLGAFLAWLDAAEERERGLDAVDSNDAEPDDAAVQILTVHAAKGLEWDIVAVPGMVESQFPGYRGKVRADGQVAASAWLTDVTALPYPLRKDAPALPTLDVAGAATHDDVEQARVDFRSAAGRHLVGEERRLAYVAVTRARSTLLLSGSWFRDGKSALPPSRFLLEARRRGPVRESAPWTPEPPAGAENPDTEAVPVRWPDPLGERRPVREAAARAVRDARAAGAGTTAAEHEPQVTRWWHDARLLLAERDAGSAPAVSLAGHLSASRVVNLVTDPAAFARELRRPVPAEPTVVSRRGTRFHQWVEHFYGRSALMDLDDVPGSGEDALGTDLGDDELADLQATFAASQWATREPVAVEVDLETPVAGTTVRCRIDAVFAGPDGAVVVDWKTGRPPTSAEDLARREMQLALYRLAWSRATGTPLNRVDAAFYYVGHDTTVRAGALDEAEIVERITAALRG